MSKTTKYTKKSQLLLTKTNFFSYNNLCKLVAEEVKKYKNLLDKNKTQYKIISEETQADGSVIIEIKKQHNCTFLGVKREVNSCGFREIGKLDSDT